MKVVIRISDDIAQRIQEKHPDLSRYVLECVALECYRSQILDEEGVRRLLNLETRFEVYALLKRLWPRRKECLQTFLACRRSMVVCIRRKRAVVGAFSLAFPPRRLLTPSCLSAPPYGAR